MTISHFYLRMRAEYVTTFKTELQRCSQWITFLDTKVQKMDGEAEDFPGYKQLQEDHAVGRYQPQLKQFKPNWLLGTQQSARGNETRQE